MQHKRQPYQTTHYYNNKKLFSLSTQLKLSTNKVNLFGYKQVTSAATLRNAFVLSYFIRIREKYLL